MMAFASKNDIVKHLKEQYLKEGVVLTTQRSDATRVLLKCDLGGCYRNRLLLSDEGRLRKTSSRLTGCPFQISCTVTRGVWVYSIVSGSHNHAVGEDLAGHAVVRRPTTEERAKIQQLGSLGVAPKHILSVLHIEFDGNKSTAQHVYNVLQSTKAEFLRGRSPIEALADLVSEDGYISNVWLKDRDVIGVFFMHKDSVALAKVYNTVFLLDCTYKTNKFNMPLLNIVGIACTYATFNAGFAFLREETEEHYTWALKQLAAVVHPKVLCTDRELALMKSIASVFPTSHNLLCVWHINKNLASRCKKYFTNGEQWDTFLAPWNRLVSFRTEVTFAKEFAVFQQTYGATNPAVMEYVNST